MKKKIIGIFFISVLFCIIGITNSFAFCVHNETDISLDVKEYSGGSFVEKLSKGETKCCDWRSKLCNTQGKEDSIVKLSVRPGKDKSNYFIIASGRSICSRELKASAHLVVKGSNGKYECIVYDKY